MIGEHATEFLGQPIFDYTGSAGGQTPTVCGLALDYEEWEKGPGIVDRLASLLNEPFAARLQGLVLGCWGFDLETGSAALVAALAAAAPRLPALRGIFLGDIIAEEQECSWIKQGDITPLLTAFPRLETLRVRGSDGLKLMPCRHERLRQLIVETGGLPMAVVDGVLKCDLPALEHLELWLGTDNYGFDGEASDFAPLLHSCPFPALRHLGLCNSEIADELAELLAKAPVLAQLRELDLSLGTLTDRGAAALCGSSGVQALQRLDLHHHYVTAPWLQKLAQLGPTVDLAEAQNERGDQDPDDRMPMLTE